MKKIGAILLTLALMLTVAVSPVLAKGGGGGGGGHSGSGSSSHSGNVNSNSGGANKGGVSSSEKGGQGSASSEKVHGSQTSGKNTTQGQKINSTHALKAVNTDLVQDFSDTSGHWASKAIKTVKSWGIIHGYSDGSFRPDSPVTNSEMVVMTVQMAELLGTDQQNGEAVTDDTTVNTEAGDAEQETAEEIPAWAQPAVKKAGALKMINVNRFHSQVQATRAQAAIMLAKALNLTTDTEGQVPFSDVGYLSGEDLSYLAALQQAGIIHGSPDGKFNPNSAITRGEIAAMLAQVAQAAEDSDSQDTTDQGTTV